MNTKHFFLCLLLFFLCQSCFNKKENDDALVISERAVPCRIKCNNTISDTAPIVPLEIANQFYKYINQFEGGQFNIVKKPDAWAIECKLTPFSPDFDIWIVSNIGESFIKLLVTLTTDETPTVIQALPIAYNIAIEELNYIESEFWAADIDNSYNIIVSKKYERLYSIIDDSTENKSNTSTKQDNYFIELNGKIGYKKPETFDSQYNAIVQFADVSVVGNLDEDWVLNSIAIQERTEPLNIFFVVATAHFNAVEITDYHGEVVDIVDISSFITKHNAGYLLLKKGEKTLFVPYDAPEKCLQKAESYFNVEIVVKNEEQE